MRMDKELCIKLYDEYYRDVQRLALSFTGNIEDSLDIVQDVFLKLLKGNVSLCPGSEKSWLLTVTANECRNFLKKKKPDCEVPENVQAGTDEYGTWELLESLRPEERAVIQLYYFDGYSQKEIAKILGLSMSGVSMRLTRAKRRLKEELGE